ncbi:MAG TPA: aldo/keto reductase [Candidatus Marinimicrobia bacterium]|nr:aldo/keto reductase [Candidatus Neomarinimicrobiota bacterium]
MEYRNLGRSGLKLSALSYGSWVTFHFQVNEALAVDLLKTAYDAGVNFFDNAEAYAHGESEIIMGRALKKLNFPRDTYCVSSKVFWGGEKPTQQGLCHKHIVDACHCALQRLQVDYLDLYFCHRSDPETPIEETVRAMHTLVMQGKICYWGTSEWSAEELKEAYKVSQDLGLTPPTMEQPEYNLFQRGKIEKEYRDFFQDYGLGTTIWSPLSSGVLTGKYKNGIPSGSRPNLVGYEWMKDSFESADFIERIKKADKLEEVAEETGMPLVNLALGWCLQNPDVSTVILGASSVEQLKENLKTVNYIDSFTDDLIDKIESIVQTKPN